MKKVYGIGLMITALVFAVTACGEGTEEPGVPEETLEQAESMEQTEDQGVVVAKAILNTYDRAVREVVELVQDKPEISEVKPEIKAVIDTYTGKMEVLNKRYLALKEEDIALFGSANRYLGEYRGKHVFKQNQALGTIRYQYQKESGDEEMDHLLHWGLIGLLDKAVER